MLLVFNRIANHASTQQLFCFAATFRSFVSQLY